MKRLLIAGSVLALAITGCKSPETTKLTDRLDALEKRVEGVEKARGPSRPMPTEQETAYTIPTGTSYVMGNKDAKVSVVVFSDYQCPYCSKADPILQAAINDPELKGKVNLVFKHFPLGFHENAKPASKAALAAGEQGTDKFWAMSNKLFENQGSLSTENYKKWAKEIGLNVAKFEKDLKANDAKYEEAIKNDMDVGTNQAKVRGTPSIYVGGWELRERSVDGIKSMIKEKKLM